MEFSNRGEEKGTAGGLGATWGWECHRITPPQDNDILRPSLRQAPHGQGLAGEHREHLTKRS